MTAAKDIALRRFPAPYQAMLAICSDTDGCSVQDFADIHRLLNTEEDTPWGRGLGLDVSDSFWVVNDRVDGGCGNPALDALDSGLSLFERLDANDSTEQQAWVLGLLETGWVDTLHSLGNLKLGADGEPQRDASEVFVRLRQCGSFLANQRRRISVWTDHGRVPFNLRIARVDAGDNPSGRFYVGALVEQLGIEFFDVGDGIDLPGHDSLLIPRTLVDGQRLWGFPRFVKTRDEGVIDSIPEEFLEVVHKRPDGSRTVVLWHPQLLPYQLSPRVLDGLVERGQYMVAAQHLGWRSPGARYEVSGPAGFTRETIEAFARLRAYQDAGKILVAGTARLLEYHRAHDYLEWSAVADGERLVIDITAVDDPLRGRFVPAIEQVRGITFEIPPDKRDVELRLAGEPLRASLIARGDVGGRAVVGVAWHGSDLKDYGHPEAVPDTDRGAEKDYTAAICERLREEAPVEREEAFTEAQFAYAVDYARDRFCFDLEHYRRIYDRIGFTGASRVLDLGCCVGDWSAGLAALGSEVVGVDKNEVFLSVGRQLLAETSFADRISFAPGEAEALEFPDESFDCVLCHGMLMFTEHERSLAEIARLLKPGGRFYVGYTDFGYRLSMLFADLLRDDLEQVMSKARILLGRYTDDAGLADCGFGRIRLYRREQLVELAACFGLQPIGEPGVQDARGSQFGEPFTYDCVFEKGDAVAPTEGESAQSLIGRGAPRRVAAQLGPGAAASGEASKRATLVRAALKSGSPELADPSPEGAAKGALKRIRESLAASPRQDVEIVSTLAMCAHAARDFAAAAAAYEEARNQLPASSAGGDELALLHAIALMQAGDSTARAALDALQVDARAWQLPWLGRMFLACQDDDIEAAHAVGMDWAKAMRARALESNDDVARMQCDLAIQRLRQRQRAAAAKRPAPVPQCSALIAHPQEVPIAQPDYSVLLAPIDQAGQPAALVRALRERSVDARMYEFRAHPFAYGSDLVLDPKALRRNRSKALFDALEYLLAQDFDLYHFWHTTLLHFSLHRGLTGMDLPLIKSAGSAVLFRFTGWDARRTDEEQVWNPHSAFKHGYTLNGYMSDDDKRRWLDHLRCYVDCFIVQDPELGRYVPEARIVPRAIDLAKWESVGGRHSARPVLVHAPTDTGSKGTALFEAALERLADEGLDFEYRPLRDLSNVDMRAQMAAADIVLDQLHIGWYGVTTVEAMALGKPSVVYVHPEAEQALGEVLPVAHADPDNVTDVLRAIIKDADHRIELGAQARNFAERHHCAGVVASRLDEIYRELRPAPRDPGRRDRAVAAVAWLGSRNVNAGQDDAPKAKQAAPQAAPEPATPAKPVPPALAVRRKPPLSRRILVFGTARLRAALPPVAYRALRAAWRRLR